MSHKTASIRHCIDTDIQNTSGIRILVSTDGGNWQDEYSISTDANLGDSDLILTTQKAIKTYINSHQKWSENEYGIYQSDHVCIGIEASHITSVSGYLLYVNGNLKANDIGLAGSINFSEDEGLDWGSGDGRFFLGSDGMLHVEGMDGIYLKRAANTIATINAYGLGIGTVASADGKMAVSGTIVSDNAFRLLSAGSDLSITTNTTSSRHVISSTEFPIAILEEGETGGGVVISKAALYPFINGNTNLGTSLKRFFEGYINTLWLNGDITSDKSTDTEISVTVADKNLLLKTASGTGKVKMNKAMSFQLTRMAGGILDVGTKYEKIARQLVPPELGGLKLKAMYVSCNPQVGDTDFYIQVYRSPGAATNVTYNNLLIEDTGLFQLDSVTDCFVTETGTPIASPTVYDKDAITIAARYKVTPTTKAQDVVVTLMFDF
ncbi:MAG: hypothetical protein RBR21_09735 [Bacteroidales bacterium]|nr:hypothetical protein [Bacteroidales bacterium]